MKNSLICSFLLAAAVVSAAPSNLPAELKYDRLAVEYAGGGDVRSYGVGGQALLGGRFLVGGAFSENRFKNLGTTSGRGADVTLGYVLPLAKGDLIATVGYGQVQATGQSGTKAIALLDDTTSLGLTWRQRISEVYEFSLGYGHATDRRTIRSTVGTTTTTTTPQGHEGSVDLGLRYKVGPHLDLTFGYTFVAGPNRWTLSSGYTF